MLRLIEGGFFSPAKDLIIDEIKKLTQSGIRSYLIVPEQQTVSAEREMAECLPTSAPLYFEVTNFTRLANTVFRSLGGLAGEVADKARGALIMWRTLTELSPIISFTKSRDITAADTERALRIVKEMQAHSLTPEDLTRVRGELENADTLKDKRLLNKLSDISEIMTLYHRMLSERFSEGDDLLLLAKKLDGDGAEFFRGTAIFILGFTSFTEPQHRVIEQLMRVCDVTAALTVPKSMPDAYEYTEVKGAHSKLCRIAARRGVDVKLERVDGVALGTNPLIADIVANVFRTRGRLDKDIIAENPDTVRIFEAENPYEECDFIAADIKRQVMAGADYSDFAVVARSSADYAGIIDVSFKKAKIPIFLSEKKDAALYEAVKLIYAAFAAVLGGYRRKDVLSYAKCSLSTDEDVSVDEFELYVESWRIEGERFTDGVIWNMNPDGYVAKRRRGTDEKLLRIDRARNAIINPLMTLEESIKESDTVADYSRALLDFLLSLNIEEKLIGRAEARRRDGDEEAAAELLSLWRTVCGALDTLYDTLGEIKVSAAAFLNLIKTVFENTEFGKIPSYTESVTVGSADTLRLYNKSHIYIIGASFGKFPANVCDEAYFTDKDRAVLNKAGLEIEPERDIKSARELYIFLRAMSFAAKTLTLTYPAENTVFAKESPSDAVKKISEISDGAISTVKLSSLGINERAYTADYCLEHIISNEKSVAVEEALKASGYSDGLAISYKPIRNENMRLSKEALSLIYGDTVALTQSRIDKFVGCPMSYFCTYNLSLNPERRAEFDAANIGTFIHAVLENFFKALRKGEKSIEALTDTDKYKIIEGAARAYVGECFEGVRQSARSEITVKRLCRSAKPIIDGLCEEFSGCLFEPAFFEMRIGDSSEGGPEAATFTMDDGRKIAIYGAIDRVDTYRHGDDVYVRVVDYKTGSKVFSPDDIAEGRNLQMFLYLKSITDTKSDIFKKSLGASKDGRIIPAGVIYVKTDIGDGKIAKPDEILAKEAALAKQKRLGMLLDDEISISAMNKDYLPVTYDKKTGEPDKKSKALLYSTDGWEKISETIETVVNDIAKDMLSGEASALPLKRGGKGEACTWCDFKAFCRNAKI